MKSSWETPAREYATGIGAAVADRTINRKKPDGSIEKWADVAYRVALGNSMLHPESAAHEFEPLHHHLRQASVLMSGRHLQHGDETQPTRNMEVMTNCATSASSFILFYLLLNGSGVGRAYDDVMMTVDWCANLPTVHAVIKHDHADVLSGEIGAEFTDPEIHAGAGTITYEVPDSREGWAKSIEQIERLTWLAQSANKVLLIDFSNVRPRGSPIGGMQDRPASGPGPLMTAIQKIAALKGQGLAPWEATMNVDHFLSECVLVGGARRAARMSTKTWRDATAIGFVSVKKGGVLWSSNNSVTVDAEFWKLVNATPTDLAYESTETNALAQHAKDVFEAICQGSYHDGTGEPGLINVDRLTQKQHGIEVLADGDYAESTRFKLDDESKPMLAELAKIFATIDLCMITNPCGEIALTMLGAYCVIADVVPYHAKPADGRPDDWDNEVESAFRTAVRALLRVNTMDCLYSKEVRRTNRIGVGFTGIHTYAFARFGYGWKDLVNEQKSLPFWKAMSRFSNAVVHESVRYASRLGQNTPHTATTVKPAGTTSKLFALSDEGAHLPSMGLYLRWVQFRNDDPLIAQHRANGYPVRELKTYSGTTIVGFPTIPEICTLGMGDLLVMAGDATPEEQYEWLRLLEKYWIDGEHHGVRHDHGNQVSYTLKLKPELVSYEQFRRTLLEGQSTIKCCSVMPQTDVTVYEYQPEQPLTQAEFDAIVANIKTSDVREDVGFEHVDCASGACPVPWLDQKVA